MDRKTRLSPFFFWACASGTLLAVLAALRRGSCPCALYLPSTKGTPEFLLLCSMCAEGRAVLLQIQPGLGTPNVLLPPRCGETHRLAVLMKAWLWNGGAPWPRTACRPKAGLPTDRRELLTPVIMALDLSPETIRAPRKRQQSASVYVWGVYFLSLQ